VREIVLCCKMEKKVVLGIYFLVEVGDATRDGNDVAKASGG
jgi:hypothetical protein